MPYLKLGCLFLTGVAVYGQSLKTIPVSGSRGENIAIEISLDAPADSRPSALQWQLVFPAQLLELSKPPVEPSGSVKSADKALTCADRNAYTLACILSGGSKTILNGLIATVHLKIRSEAKPGTTTIHLSRIEGVTSDLRPLPMKDLDASITIR